MRFSIAASAAILFALPSPAHACCLTDWLFGRSTATYAAGYAPVATTGVVAAAVPTSPAPLYAAAPSYANPTTPSLMTTPGYSAAYPAWSTNGTLAVPVTAPAVVAPPTSSSLIPPPVTTSPLATNGVIQAQRPAYIDNPSVYTGLPVARTPAVAPVTAYSPAVPATTYRGTFNPYQVTGAYSAGTTGFSAGQVAPATGVAPAVVPVVPIARPQPIRRGLARFFGSLLGLNYNTTYYQAPITYYRPATTVDPVTGTTVTVQQPCTSTVQQVQRTPYASLWSSPSTPAPLPTSQPYCQSVPGAVTSIPSSTLPSTYAPNTIGQTSASVPMTSNPLNQCAPPPTSSTYGQNTYPQNVPTPLTGSPPSAPLQSAPAQTPPSSYGAPSKGSSGGTNDMTPVPQPRIESARTTIPQHNSYSNNGASQTAQPRSNSASSNTNGSSTGTGTNTDSLNQNQSSTSSRWKLQNPADSTALIRPRASTNSSVEPIRAPADYRSPFRRQNIPLPSTSSPANASRPSQSDSFEAPPLPKIDERRYEEMTSVSNRRSTPAREAALIQRRPSPPQPPQRSRAPQRRDNVWVTVE